jgi:hypothetical protein
MMAKRRLDEAELGQIIEKQKMGDRKLSQKPDKPQPISTNKPPPFDAQAETPLHASQGKERRPITRR